MIMSCDCCGSGNSQIKLSNVIYIETAWEPPEHNEALLFIFCEVLGKRKEGNKARGSGRMAARACLACAAK